MVRTIHRLPNMGGGILRLMQALLRETFIVIQSRYVGYAVIWDNRIVCVNDGEGREERLNGRNKARDAPL